MTVPRPILAVSREIMDNVVHEEGDRFPAGVALMSDDERRAPVWGTADKARLAELVEGGRMGDLAAMEAIYEMFKRPVFGLAYRHTANRAVAEDLLQDIFLKVFSHFQNVRDAETFPAWVYRIALNTCYSYLRQKRSQGANAVSLEGMEGRLVDDASAPVESDLKGPLAEAVKSLAPRLRSVFVLHDVQGYKHEEIARLLGCTAGTSKSQLFKARMKLRTFLKARKAV